MKTEDIDMAALEKDLRKLTQAKQRGWFRRNWKWAVPLFLLVVVVVGGGVGYWAMFLRVYNLDVCKSAMKDIAADKAVCEALGEPIDAVKWPSQEALPNARIDDSEIDVIWHIAGSKGKAKAHVTSRKRQGKWSTVVLEVTLADGKKLPIRTSGDAANEAKAWVPGANPGPASPDTKRPETKNSDLNIDLPIPPADGPPEAK